MKTQNTYLSLRPSIQGCRSLARYTCAAGILLGFASTSMAQPVGEELPPPPPPTVEENPPPSPPPTDEATPVPTPAPTSDVPDASPPPTVEATPPPTPADVQSPPPPPVESVAPPLPPAPAPIPPPPSAPAETAAPNTPGFATMDRANGDSFIEVTGAFTRYDGDQPDFNFRTELYGQYIAPSGIGGYVGMPFAVVGDSNESVSGIAHYEFGGIYNIVSDANTQWILRGGILTNPSDDADTFAANLLTSYNRLTDFSSVFPDSSWLRLAFSRLHRSDKVFLRGDVGLDVNISAPEGVDPDSLLRVNFGVGYDSGGTIFALEMVNLGTTGDVDGGDRYLTNFALSVRGGRTSGYDTFLSLVLPVDDGFMDLGLLTGLRFPLGG